MYRLNQKNTIIVSILFILASVLNSQPVQKNDSLVTLLFAGDVTLANHFQNHVQYDFSYPFKKLDWFANADITMVNLENPLSRSGAPVEKAYTFRTHPEYVHILEAGGIDIVTLANNHMYDYGPDGLYDTIRILDKTGVKRVGAGKNLDDARKPVIYRIKGIKLAYLAYYGLGKHSDSHPATKDSSGTAMRSLKYISEDIKRVRDSVDFIIVNFHWGLEKDNYPGKDQVYFAHEVIKDGADLIIGHHPHVLQGIELYKEKVIAYSLGNFIFGGNSRIYEQTIVLKVQINPKAPNQFEVTPIPIKVSYWQPELLKGKQADNLLDKLKEYSSIFEMTIFAE